MVKSGQGGRQAGRQVKKRYRWGVQHVDRIVDRHGHERFYYRRDKGLRTPLPAWGSAEWLPAWTAAHQAAESGIKLAGSIGASSTMPGSLSAALVAYYVSNQWTKDLAEGSRAMRRPILEKMREQCGNAPIRDLQRAHIQPLIDRLKPNAQKNWMKALRGFLKFCLSTELIKTDPTQGVVKAKAERSDGHLAWTEDNLEQFRSHFALGTRERLAIELMVNLGVRRSDCCRLGPSDFKGGWLRDFTPKKTARTSGVKINLPVHPELAAAIAAMAVVSTGAYLVTDHGRPFASEASFGMWMRRACDRAGLTEVSSHGLRKLAAIRLAFAGASINDLMKMFGWRTPAQAQLYIDQADAMRVAADAMARLVTYQNANKVSPTFDPGLGKKL
jgi:integrase